jgi:copper(I)-binding protein
MKIFYGTVLAIITFTTIVMTNTVKAEGILVEEGYIRASIPGTTSTSAYMVINNQHNKLVVLTGASSSVSDRIEIHEHTMTDGMMKMRQRASLDIPANSQVRLQPSGYHLMFFNLAKGLEPKQDVTLTLAFKNGDTHKVTLPVESIKHRKPANHSHH